MSYQRFYDLSVLSNKVYEQPYGPINGYTESYVFINDSEIISGDGFGFYAAAYRNSNNPDDVIIVYRGTDGIFDALPNVAIAGLADWDVQFDQAISFADYVMRTERATNPNAQFTVTGHSLGGSLAQVVAAMFELNGAAFDPGGAANIVASTTFANRAADLEAQNPNSSINFGGGAQASFRNFIVEGSPVSQWSGSHVNDNNIEYLDFFAYNQDSEVIISVNSSIVTYGLLNIVGFKAAVRANVVTLALKTKFIHSSSGISTLLSIKAGEEFNENSLLQLEAQKIINYFNATGNIGFDDNPPLFQNQQYISSVYRSVLFADNGNNNIVTSASADTIFGLGGDDVITSVGFGDTVDGGAG
ncbi:DUF2974 domain-containing protein, partial [Novosphingobium sp. AAP83]|uniref:lipase family protein n=1 Tax=Novosphingobium sp. AAP83 TaxID=1523425 RepID=UPI0012FB41CB